MTSRVSLVALALLASPAAALAAGGGVQPLSGESVIGSIAFPRAQKMAIDVGPRDRLALSLGFDGRCAGGGIGEVWMSFVPAKQSLKVTRGAFKGVVTGTSKGVGGDQRRTAFFSWHVSGRFTAHEAATVTVSGTALVREGSKLISRCTIARPATAKLTHKSS